MSACAVYAPGVTARPSPSSPGVTLRMSRQARKDTQPELDLRRILHAAGLRYRVGLAVPGLRRRTMDIAFTRLRLAVFVDGCFWHGCPSHGTAPKANSEWWAEKIARNRARDVETTEHLAELGWAVLRIWEHETATDGAELVLEALQERGGQVPPLGGRGG